MYYRLIVDFRMGVFKLFAFSIHAGPQSRGVSGHGPVAPLNTAQNLPSNGPTYPDIKLFIFLVYMN